eukprot:m.207356 g.207356  ORF g.207356 m.207356 type:complete len:1535 (-) comp17787_c2_seq3:312-4916(-)
MSGRRLVRLLFAAAALYVVSVSAIVPENSYTQSANTPQQEPGKQVHTAPSSSSAATAETDADGHQWTDTWAVRIEGGEEAAKRVAERNGYVYLNKIVGDHYHFRHACDGVRGSCVARHRRSDEHTSSLLADSEVLHAEQQKLLKRSRRMPVVPNDVASKTENQPQPHSIARRGNIPSSDPLWPQWFLYQDNGQHINVLPVWAMNITGLGVRVTVVDDGMEYTHPDLWLCHDLHASYDFNDNDDDPMPREEDPINKHGTRCSGQIGMQRDNGVCGIGIAYNASVGAVRMLDGPVTDSVEASSLGLRPEYIDIYTSSWGPNDDGVTMEGPGPLATEALSNGAAHGRGGKGSIFLFANGNGGRSQDNCNCDGYSNSIYTIAIGAISEQGVSPWYSEQCAATVTVTYSSGTPADRAISTVDLGNRCTHDHTGTSAASPMAAGIVALVLQANPNLSWRDVQHVLIHGAQMTDPDDADWYTTATGLHVNHKYGFGKMDATKLVQLAKAWTLVGERIVNTMPVQTVEKPIPFSEDRQSSLLVTMEITADVTSIRQLEHVQLAVNADMQRRGDYIIELVCPSGTPSTMLSARSPDYTTSGVHWTFMTLRCWDESPIGTWTLAIRNAVSRTRPGRLTDWQLIISGHTGFNSSSSCAANQFKDATTGACIDCHAECSSKGCTGAGNASCVSCAHFADGHVCLANCSEIGKLADAATMTCKDCDAECKGGCTGPTAFDCVDCMHEKRVTNPTSGQFECIGNCSRASEFMTINGTCEACHVECVDGCAGPTENDCKSCAHLVVGNHTCVAECPAQFFAKDDGRCYECDAQCSVDGCTGPGPVHCIKCSGLFVRLEELNVINGTSVHNYTFECVAECPSPRIAVLVAGSNTSKECVCPDNMYSSPQGECLMCHRACATCTGPNATDCTMCAVAIYRSTCVSACPSLSFLVPEPISVSAAKSRGGIASPAECASCNAQCASGCVGSSPTNCTDGGSGRCVSLEYTGACVATCPLGSYASNQTCLACDAQCGAQGCTAAGPSNCVDCLHFRNNGSCVDACPPMNFVDRNGRCQKCHSECAQACNGATNSDCMGDLPAACKSAVMDGGQCVSSCPAFFYLNASRFCVACDAACNGCTGPTSSDCIQCKGFLINGTCGEACPVGFYGNSSHVCVPCHASCGALGCVGPTQKDCATKDCGTTPCPVAMRYDTNCVCVFEPCAQYRLGNDCVASCSADQYSDSDKTCLPCHEQCVSGCTGPAATECVACKNVKLNGSCIASCPSSFFADHLSECQPCHAECSECHGLTAMDCADCVHVKFNGECIHNCPNDTYLDNYDCVACHPECSGGCEDDSAQSCFSCKHVRSDGTCMQSCPPMTYQQADGCLACSSECLEGCTGPSPGECSHKKCANFKLEEDGVCVAKCPGGTYGSSEGICEDCDSSCGNFGCTGPGREGCRTPITIPTDPTTHASTTRSPTERVDDTSSTFSGERMPVTAIIFVVIVFVVCVVFIGIRFGVFSRIRKAWERPTPTQYTFLNEDDDEQEPDLRFRDSI